MAQFSRPSSDVATGGWTATPLWSKIDEGSPGDDVVITSADNSSPDNADGTLSSVTDPASSTGHILRAAWNKGASGGHSINAVLELWQGIPGTGSLVATLSVTGIGDVEQTDTHTLTGTEADSITDYSNLHYRVSRQGDTGGQPATRRSLVVDFLELEVPDAGASPVAVEAAPSAMSIAASVVSVVVGALSIAASPATATITAQAVTPVAAPAVVQAAPASVSADAQAVQPSLGSLAVEVVPAPMTVAAQAVTPEVSGSPVSVEAAPGTLSVEAQAVTLALGAASVGAAPATISVLAQTALPVAAPIEVVASPSTLAVEAQAVSPQVAGSPVVVSATPALITISARAVVPAEAGGGSGSAPIWFGGKVSVVVEGVPLHIGSSLYKLSGGQVQVTRVALLKVAGGMHSETPLTVIRLSGGKIV